MERKIEFYPAYDKRNTDPNKNYGMGGVTLSFYLIGEKGAIQFVVYTNWHLPHVQHEIDSKPPKEPYPYLSHSPTPADIGYHSYKPMYEGQLPMEGECHLLGKTCYYDGSGLQAEDVFKILLEGGSEAVWKDMERRYAEQFQNEFMEEG